MVFNMKCDKFYKKPSYLLEEGFLFYFYKNIDEKKQHRRIH